MKILDSRQRTLRNEYAGSTVGFIDMFRSRCSDRISVKATGKDIDVLLEYLKSNELYCMNSISPFSKAGLERLHSFESVTFHIGGRCNLIRPNNLPDNMLFNIEGF